MKNEMHISTLSPSTGAACETTKRCDIHIRKVKKNSGWWSSWGRDRQKLSGVIWGHPVYLAWIKLWRSIFGSYIGHNPDPGSRVHWMALTPNQPCVHWTATRIYLLNRSLAHSFSYLLPKWTKGHFQIYFHLWYCLYFFKSSIRTRQASVQLMAGRRHYLNQ